MFKLMVKLIDSLASSFPTYLGKKKKSKDEVLLNKTCDKWLSGWRPNVYPQLISGQGVLRSRAVGLIFWFVQRVE